VQVYDYKQKKSRVAVGPDLIRLDPDEQFTLTHLSGGKPKRPGVIKTLNIGLGPDFFTDIVVVETSDHARISLQLSYNWLFEIDIQDEAQKNMIFNVRDFVGDACSAVASKIRGTVAGVSFDTFHKLSAKTIRRAIFGVDKDGKIGDRLFYDQNNLLLFNVDIQNIEPVDETTKKSLQKSMTLAIEITKQMQEAEAERQAQKIEQEARGALEKQSIEDEATSEQTRRDFLEVKAETSSIETSGQAIAEAKARSRASEIECETEVLLAELRAEAKKYSELGEIDFLKQKQIIELEAERKKNELKIKRAKELGDIESSKFASLVGAIGTNTLVQISRAGPESQAKMLKGLGLQGFMMMDGKNPINLFTAANGMMGNFGGNFN